MGDARQNPRSPHFPECWRTVGGLPWVAVGKNRFVMRHSISEPAQRVEPTIDKRSLFPALSPKGFVNRGAPKRRVVAGSGKAYPKREFELRDKIAAAGCRELGPYGSRLTRAQLCAKGADPLTSQSEPYTSPISRLTLFLRHTSRLCNGVYIDSERRVFRSYKAKAAFRSFVAEIRYLVSRSREIVRSSDMFIVSVRNCSLAVQKR